MVWPKKYLQIQIKFVIEILYRCDSRIFVKIYWWWDLNYHNDSWHIYYFVDKTYLNLHDMPWALRQQDDLGELLEWPRNINQRGSIFDYLITTSYLWLHHRMRVSVIQGAASSSLLEKDFISEENTSHYTRARLRTIYISTFR